VEVEEHTKMVFTPFEQYMDFLAEGKLGRYLDSNDCKDKIDVPDMMMSTNPNILLH
jgi:hypothetical protein